MRTSPVLVSVICSGLAGTASAAGNAGAGQTPVPRHLASMDKVRDEFGTPVRTPDAVGDPAITRWVCGDHTACFEGDLVLTSVRHRAP